jgi:hypothetical protein
MHAFLSTKCLHRLSFTTTNKRIFVHMTDNGVYSYLILDVSFMAQKIGTINVCILDYHCGIMENIRRSNVGQ